jgi:protein-disulfide isomerase
MANGLTMGDPNAPVKIDVYEDFQCPACLQYTETTEKQLIDTYIAKGQVYYVFHQYPFIDSNSTTKESHQAANASMCANAQGRFWDYHDMLFNNWNGENQGGFTNKRLLAFAQALGLNMNEFRACFDANQYKAQIQQDYQQGEALGVHSTPTVFVNGTEVTPGYIPSYQDLSKAIDAALAKK